MSALSFWARARALFLCLSILTLAGLTTVSRAQGYSDVKDFDETDYAIGIAIDSAGNRYGVTGVSNQPTLGLVWKETASGSFSIVHSFSTGTVSYFGGGSGPDGTVPTAPPLLDSSGNLYGTCYSGGANGNGVLWEYTSTGSYLVLHSFGGSITDSGGSTGPDGKETYGSLAIDSSGNLYGATYVGGANGEGMVWELTGAGSYTDLYDFGSSGQYPAGGVTSDSAGDLYGIAYSGGAHSRGTLWEIPAGGSYEEVHQFGSGNDGQYPTTPVTLDVLGDVFGTTGTGGMNGSGTIWEYSSAGVYTVLHSFGGSVKAPSGQAVQDGGEPYFWNPIRVDQFGNLFGTTFYYGNDDSGMVWELTKFGVYVDLHDFADSPDGEYPSSVVASDPTGNLFGVTYAGGAGSFGIEWELSAITGVTLSASSVLGANTTTGTVTIPFSAPSGGWAVNLSSSNPTYASVPSSVTIAEGQTSATFTVTTKDYVVPYQAIITANDGYVIQQAQVTVEPLKVYAFSLAPQTVTYGNSTTGTVLLSGPAPAGGWLVNLSSTNSHVSMPSSVTIPQGQSSATFSITPGDFSSNYTAVVKESDSLSSISQILSVSTINLSSISVSPNPVSAGGECTGTVTLSRNAPSGGWTVNLKSSTSYVGVPSSVTVAQGSSTATFPVTAGNYLSNYTATVTATDSVSSKSAALTVDSTYLSSITASPNPVTVGGSITGTVTISRPAPATGWTVNLSSSTSYVAVPASVILPSGATTATFPITATNYAANYAATITGTDSVSTRFTELIVDSVDVASVTVSPGTVANGTSAQGTVTLTGPAPAGGMTVQLTSSDPGYASVPVTLTVAQGATQANFTVTTGLQPIKVIYSITIKATIAGASQSTTLSLTP